MENQHSEAVQISEEQLRRTYKGIEFRTEEEKNRIEALEKEAAEYCKQLEDKSYKELFEKNEQWKNLPSSIFMSYTIKLMAEIGEKEKQEIEIYKEKIAKTELSELPALQYEIEQQKYSAYLLSQAYSVLKERKRACQVLVLDEMLLNYTSLTRNDLKNLKADIIDKHFEEDLTNIYINRINAQYDIVEQEELKNLCLGIESMDMKELEGSLRIIAEGDYQEKFSSQYVTLINNKIEELQYRELEELTAGKEEFDKERLVALYKQLEQGNYNPKFVKKFMVEIRMCIDKRDYDYVSNLTANVLNSDKETVLNLEREVEATGFNSGILYVARKKIADRKFELEMNELIDMCNDFDNLSDEATDNLINAVREKDYSQSAKTIYMDKLTQRKFNIALAQVNKLSAALVQAANKYGVGGRDILIASKSDAFLNAFRSLKAAHPTSGEYDIPAFIMSGSINMAMSYKYCYLNSGSKQALIDINNISGFTSVKKLLSESLVVQLKDGSSVAVAGGISKQMLPSFILMMNEYLGSMNDKILLDTYTVPSFNVEPLNRESYSSAKKNYELDRKGLMLNSLGAVFSSEQTKEMAKALHFEGNKDWEQYQSKTKANYQILPEENLVFVYDKSLLNSAKEGFAFSSDKMFVKKSAQPLITLTMKDIFAVKCDENSKIYAETVGLNPIYLDVNASANCAMYIALRFDEYVRNMQLCTVVS